MKQIATELVGELRRIFDDDEFVQGILILAETCEDREIVLEFIRTGINVTVETVTVMAMEIDIARYGQYNDRSYNEEWIDCIEEFDALLNP